MKIKKIMFISAFVITIISCSKEPIDTENTLSIGVFGGSVSSLPESEAAKKAWKNSLDTTAEITTCGIGGMGFSTLTSTEDNVPMQIAKAKPFDIYILWASTNDVAVQCPIGDIGTKDPITQSGGLLKSIELIKQKNSKALILLFTSLPRFDKQTIYDRMPDYVSAQKAFCEHYSIPYLDQWSICGFDFDNFTPYYFSDKVHLTVLGYEHIVPMQIDFMKKNIQNHFKEKFE